MIALTAPQRLKSAQSRSPIGSPDFSEIHINGQVVSESVCDLLQSFPKLSCEVRIDLDVHMVCLFTLHNTATSRVFCPLLPTLIGPFRKMPVKDFVVLFLHVCTYQGASFPILAYRPLLSSPAKGHFTSPNRMLLCLNFLCILMCHDRCWSFMSQ